MACQTILSIHKQKLPGEKMNSSTIFLSIISSFWTRLFLICLLVFGFWSMWTLLGLTTYLSWTIVDIWLTTYLPHLIHVVFEWPLERNGKWLFYFPFLSTVDATVFGIFSFFSNFFRSNLFILYIYTLLQMFRQFCLFMM